MKERIDSTNVIIKDKKKTYEGAVKRISLFSKVKVVEVETNQAETFYFIYFNDKLVYGNKLAEIQEDSFIDRIHNQGITFSHSHPLYSRLLPGHSIYIPNKSKLFHHLNTQYSLPEVAYIATTLDSFIDKEHLIKVIDKIYFHYRRNGNFFKAYRVNLILSAFAPSLTTAERMQLQEYIPYDSIYRNNDLSSLYTKDPFYIELESYKQRNDPDSFTTLEQVLIKQERLLELTCIRLEKLMEQLDEDAIETYTASALEVLSLKEWVLSLCAAHVNAAPLIPGTKKMIEDLIEDGEYKSASYCLLPFIEELPTSYDDLVIKLLEKADFSFLQKNLSPFLYYIDYLVREKKSRESERLLSQVVEQLFLDNDLLTIKEKLLPFSSFTPHSIVLQKVDTMTRITEDPNRMMELGQYFADFKQYDQAIDCFFWEMELRPDDPEPVRNIMKMYQLKGMNHEAVNYQQLLTQLIG